MDKNTSLERRFSMNATHLSSYPIAESTCVNSNGIRSNQQFQWGSTPISPLNRSSSNIRLSNIYCSKTQQNSHNGRNNAISSERDKANLSKIDPRIYADVQSKGLASRIVKYHEHGTRLNRSMSMNNLYNKPGQFPIVHLNKSELPYKAIRKPLSMTHIAPPERSMFPGNTLSNLLRSNSALQKTDEEISRENRPILHPPPTENDYIPTPSVLDVLKEISRKRINNDDSKVNESTKKYCNRGGTDNVEGMSNPLQQQKQSQQVSNSIPTLSYKRQREQITSSLVTSGDCGILSHTTQLMNNSKSNQRIQQHSPEQLAKKRLCSYNNDITSSLSSSVFHANKRKFYEQQRNHSRSSASLSPAKVPIEYEVQKPKIQRQQDKANSILHFEQLSKSIACHTPITPLPTTPLDTVGVPLGSVPEATNSNTTICDTTGVVVPLQNNTTTTLYASQSAPVVCLRNKPKLTLFNKQYDDGEKEDKAAREHGEKKEKTNEDACAGIQFVKPKKSSYLSNKTPLMVRTQKSKLAMMLCGLKGELYQGGEDEIDADGQLKQTVPQVATTTNVPITAVPSIATKPTTIKTSTKANSLTFSTTPATTTEPAEVVKDGAMKESSEITKITACATSTTAPVSSTNAPSVTSSISQATLGGFQLTSQTITATSNNVLKPQLSTKTSSPLVGLKLTPQVTVSAAATSAASVFSASSLNCSAPAATTATTLVTSSTTPNSLSKISPIKSTPLPTLGGFSFAATTISKPTVTNSTVDTPGFTFNTNTMSTTFDTFNKEKKSSATVAPFAFGVGNMKPTATTDAVPSNTTTVASNFNFGINQPTDRSVNNNNSSPANQKPFAFAANSTTWTSMSTTSTASAPIANVTMSPFSAVVTTTTTSGNLNQPNRSFVFDGTATATSNSSLTISNNSSYNTGLSTTVANTGNFSFSNAPASTATPFGFGSSGVATTNAAATTTPAATAISFTSNTLKSAFQFGSENSKVSASTAPTVNNNTNNNSTTFAFGVNPPASSTTKPFAFGGAANNSVPPVFGGRANTPATTSQSPGNASLFAFGAAPKTVAPTAASQSNIFGTKTETFGAAVGGGFSFGSVATQAPNATVSTPNLFGSVSTSNVPTTGIVKPSFSFGGISSTSTNNGPDASKSLFGSNNSSTNNSFGALATNTQQLQQQQHKPFAFGAPTTATSAAPAASSVFGPPTTTASDFLFGNNTAAAAASVNNQPTATPAFNFGGGVGNSNKSTVAPFSFGAAASNKTFLFDGGSSSGGNNNSPAANLFGVHTSPNATANVTIQGMGSMGNGNAPNGNSIYPTQRPIRRATRRLQKS